MFYRSLLVSLHIIGFIHGMGAVYNDIQPWNCESLGSVFGGEQMVKTYGIRSRQELEELFSSDRLDITAYLHLIELYMRKDDAPKALVRTVRGGLLHI